VETTSYHTRSKYLLKIGSEGLYPILKENENHLLKANIHLKKDGKLFMSE